MTREKPKLLVSFRNADEITPEILAAVDFVDLKEPSNGPLGAVSNAILGEVLRKFGDESLSGKLSVALGELKDVDIDSFRSHLAAARFAKLGLSGMRNDATWRSRLQDLVFEFPPSVSLVAVAYGDSELVAAPKPEHILDFAIENRIGHFLIDTFSKNGKSIFDFLSLDRLANLRESAKRANIAFALAGSINLQNLPKAIDLEPDIIGIRGAVTLGNRHGKIEPNLVHQFRAAISAFVKTCAQ